MNSKSKGNSFERKISKLLSKWISRNETDNALWRVIDSGSRFTKLKNKNQDILKNRSGDITFLDEEYKWFTDLFSIEVKFYKNLNLETFLFKGTGKINDFWKQVTNQCIDNNKIPLLIVKQNYMPEICLTNDKGYHFFGNKYFVYYRQMNIYFYNLQDILNINPDIFKSI